MMNQRGTQRTAASAPQTDKPTRHVYTAPRLSRWGSLEDLTRGGLAGINDMDATGSQPI